MSGESAEQQARDLLERCGVEDAQSFSAGDVVELANLIAKNAAVNDKAVVRAAACIWGEMTDEFWSRATPEQQWRYIGIARAMLTVAGVKLA
jgi:hypothetical protein